MWSQSGCFFFLARSRSLSSGIFGFFWVLSGLLESAKCALKHADTEKRASPLPCFLRGQGIPELEQQLQRNEGIPNAQSCRGKLVPKNLNSTTTTPLSSGEIESFLSCCLFLSVQALWSLSMQNRLASKPVQFRASAHFKTEILLHQPDHQMGISYYNGLRYKFFLSLLFSKSCWVLEY